MKRRALAATAALFALAGLAACKDNAGPRISQPDIGSISPARGTTGASIQIHGSQFDLDSLEISFGATPAAKSTAVADSLALAVVPAGLAGGFHDVRLRNPDGGEDVLEGGFEFLPPPQLDSISPDWGPVGTEIQVHGTRFDTAGVAVYFGTVAAGQVQRETDRRIRAVVPDGLNAGFYDVRVVNDDGTEAVATGGFEVVIPPQVDSVSPASGTVGTELTIYGAYFQPDSIEVLFGDLPAPRVEGEPGLLYVVAPQGLEAGERYDIRVINDGKAADTLATAFEAVRPRAARVNGVSRPTGLIGMTAIIEGTAFSDSLALSEAKVFFLDNAGAPIRAVVADTANDWANDFIVTRVPTGTADTSLIWVETPTGVSDSIEFRLIQGGEFSPSNISWTETTPLPQPLQGLGALFVPVEEGPAPENYVFAVGGADADNVATTAVYRANIAQTGALGEWSTMTPLPAPRAYHITTAATAYTAALDTTTTAAFLYVLGGIDADDNTVATVLFAHVDLAGNVGAWATASPLPRPLHSAGAAIFRGYMYLAGGADENDTAVPDVYRARVRADGTLGEWEPIASLPQPLAYHAVVNFGPYLYTIGGETATSAPVRASQTNTETGAAYFARINVRTGALQQGGWAPVESMAKARSKHSAIFGGGALFATSGVYAGQPGSSENTFAVLNSDGTLQPWQGATGDDIIANTIGISLYNQAAITFIDAEGNGHVLVLGGADRSNEGRASAAVIYY